jgi:aryl sulfotransferase
MLEEMEHSDGCSCENTKSIAVTQRMNGTDFFEGGNMVSDRQPQRVHTYQNHTLDSTRWNHYTPRNDDIIIATSYKSGTTWMQNIVLHLLGIEGSNVHAVSPWIDARVLFGSVDDMMARLNAQTHRRFVKTHIPLDALPFYPQVKYIVVGRDARDVFMSWWNHYAHLTDAFYTSVNDTPGRVGEAMPRCSHDIHEGWRTWIARGWFEWECEGYPHSGNLYHTQSWWNFRHLENILFVHFNDLLADLEGEIRRVAHFLGCDMSGEAITTVAQAVSFSTLKKDATRDPSAGSEIWKGGMETFFFKGTNGRWQGVLSHDELAMYQTTKVKVLTTDCAQWLERGRVAFS